MYIILEFQLYVSVAFVLSAWMIGGQKGCTILGNSARGYFRRTAGARWIQESIHRNPRHWWVTLQSVSWYSCGLKFLLLPLFSGIWHGVNGCRWNPHCLYCCVIISWKYPVLLGTFICGLLWRWFPLKLYCSTEAKILYNNKFNFNKIWSLRFLTIIVSDYDGDRFSVKISIGKTEYGVAPTLDKVGTTRIEK